MPKWVWVVAALVISGGAWRLTHDVHRVVIVGGGPTLQPMAQSLADEIAARSRWPIDQIETTVVAFDESEMAVAFGSLDGDDLVLTLTTPASVTASALLEATDVPHLFGIVNDPVGSGLVDSLDRPGVNRTGLGLFVSGPGLSRLVVATGADRIGIVHFPADTASRTALEQARKAGDALGIELVVQTVAGEMDPGRLAGRFEGVDAIYVLPTVTHANRMESFVALAAALDVPAVAGRGRADPVPGLLLWVGPDEEETVRRLTSRSLALLHGVPAEAVPIGRTPLVTVLNEAVASRYPVSFETRILAERAP